MQRVNTATAPQHTRKYLIMWRDQKEIIFATNFRGRTNWYFRARDRRRKRHQVETTEISRSHDMWWKCTLQILTGWDEERSCRWRTKKMNWNLDRSILYYVTFNFFSSCFFSDQFPSFAFVDTLNFVYVVPELQIKPCDAGWVVEYFLPTMTEKVIQLVSTQTFWSILWF
jgi:hypothetical protein